MKKKPVWMVVSVLTAVCMLLSVGTFHTLSAVITTDAVEAAAAGAQNMRSAVALQYGDLTGDGRVNVRDLGLLQQYLNGWSVTANWDMADLTGDGRVNVRDLGLLQQYLNGWDVKLPDPPATESTTSSTESTTSTTESTTSTTESTTSSTESTRPTVPTRPPVSTDAVIYVESVTVDRGTAEVQVNVRVRNNPGIMTATLAVDVDDAVLGFKSASKTGYESLYLTAPGSKQVHSPYRFLLDGMELTDADKADGVLFTITFTVKDPAAVGDHAVRLSYTEGDITDENYGWLDVAVQDGTITIQ